MNRRRVSSIVGSSLPPWPTAWRAPPIPHTDDRFSSTTQLHRGFEDFLFARKDEGGGLRERDEGVGGGDARVPFGGGVLALQQQGADGLAHVAGAAALVHH